VERPTGLLRGINCGGALSRPAGNTSLPTGRQAEPCNAGFIGIEWAIRNFTISELEQGWWILMLDIQKVPLQGSYSVPAESALVFYRNVKLNIPNREDFGRKGGDKR